jgi:isoleucyl-tRNA synthetase
MAIEPVGEYNPKKLEERVLAYWRLNKVMEETLKPRDGERFSFLEGPPTANAPPALHHVEMRTYKDVVNRFHYMLGYDVPRKAGWDCHGLPVEVQVERDINLDSKRQILEYGVDRFVEKCRDSVFSHIREWDSLTERMAYWIDLKDPYVTMDNDYIESVWWSISELWKKKLLYEGYRVVPFCPRCGTPLSSHEVALGYQKVSEETVIVGFRGKDRDYSFLAWTTTPWTLLSNLALAVNPEVTYAVIKYRGERYVLAKELAEKRFPEADIVEEMKGSKLVGMGYHPLFSHFAGRLEKPAWRVVEGDFVSTEEGTGIVHIAPAFGEDDYNVGVENDLPLVNPIDQQGRFTSDVPELAGVFAKDADAKIIGWLDEMGALIARYPYEHDYPFCWRCKTPLLYYAMKSWFIKVTGIIPELMNQNSKVKWYPESIGSGRFGNWVEGARDWSLSRNRFWGTPLPIWTCGCGKVRVVGSRKELFEAAAGKVKPDLDLHRPYVDGVKLRCSCGKKMSRVEYVIDCWYDSGAATYAQFHYPFENKKMFEESFPYDFISEAVDQTRGWFYTLLVLATALFKKPAYMSCVVGGLLLDDRGEKMSKSNDNVIDPWQLFETVGADAVRLQLCAVAPWNAKRFGQDTMNESIIPLLRTLWNCYSFTVRYMLLDNFDPRGHSVDGADLAVEDEWIQSAASSLVASVKESLSRNEYHHTVAALSEFIVDDLSRWYIKLIRDRLWLEDEGGRINPSKEAAYITLMQVFNRVCLALAPLAPFITEDIYQNLLKTDAASIHQVPWPEAEDVDEELILNMKVVRAIFEAGSKCRQEAGIKLRYPIAKVTVSGDARTRQAVIQLKALIGKQLNCKEVEFAEKLPKLEYEAIPDFKVIGPKYGKEADKVAKAIKSNPSDAKGIFESGVEGELSGFKVTPEMIANIGYAFSGDYAAAGFSVSTCHGVVLIETKRSDSLMNEALARDLIRHIQELRKKHDLGELQRIKVEVSDTPSVRKMIGEFRATVLNEVRADKIELKKGLSTSETLKYGGEAIHYRISF